MLGLTLSIGAHANICGEFTIHKDARTRKKPPSTRNPSTMAPRSFVTFLRIPNNLCRRFLRRRTKRSKAPREIAPVPQFTSDHDSSSPTTSTLPSEAAQNEPRFYQDLAQRLQQLFPPSLNWLGSSDVEILDTTAVSSGSFSEVWTGSLRGRLIAVKSLRCYSSPEFNSAEVEMVCCRGPARFEYR